MDLRISELILILFFVVGAIAVIFGVFYFLARYLNIIGGKPCPHCGEKIKEVAKVCRYCQRDIADVEIENKTPRGLYR